MYLEHFGLEKKPFDINPDPDFLCFSGQHKLAFSLMEYGIHEQSGIVLITGEVGSGKTTLIRHLLDTIDHERFSVGLITHSHESLDCLIPWVAMAFSLNGDGEDETRNEVVMYKRFQHFLVEQYSLGKKALLIVDEAQNMSASILEELRLLTNINSHQDQLLNVVLVGQPELASKLADPKLSQIAQRLSVEYHIGALNWEETLIYIHHRLAVAGGTSDLICHDAIGVFFYHSGGIPRLLNTLCDCALVYAYASGEATASFQTAIDVMQGRKLAGINRSVSNKEPVETVRRMLIANTGRDIAIAG